MMTSLAASLASASMAWICLWCFGLTFVSAVIPWVNAEIIVLSLPAFASSRAGLLGLVLVAAAGQMTGKCVVYWVGREGGRILKPRIESAAARWRDRLAARPRKAAILVLVSSITGIPPFYLMSLVAGALRMNFAVFLAAGTAGRLVRFGALVSLPKLVLAWF